MSVVGVDLGTYKTCIASVRNRGVDIIDNEVSNRFTPAMVGFTGDQRLLGEAAKTQEVMNFKNTVTGIHRLLGRDFNDPEVQHEKGFALYKLVAGPNNETAAEVNYQGEQKVFTMTQLAAMYLTQIKKTAEAALKMPVSDIVLSVPVFYTDRQRHALMNAAEIAGLNPLRLMNDTAAAVLQYGITRVSDLPDTEPRHVVFVDAGYTALSVTVGAFTKEKAVIKSTAVESNLGGRYFDEDLVKHFAKEIEAKHKIDVYSKPKALLRLRVACEKLKKVLSANSTAVLNVENLTDEVDVRSEMTRDQFEELVKVSLERVESPLRVALHNSGIRKEQVEFVELVGGTARVPAIRKIISDFFGNREGILSTTLNFDEAVTRGCALQCAMLSPLFKVREYGLKDVTVFNVKNTWTTESGEAGETVVFKEGDGLPSTKALTFHRTAPFEVQAMYVPTPQQLASGVSLDIAKFLVKDVKPINDKPAEVKVKVRLNPSGIFSVESAHIVEEVDEPSASSSADKMDVTPAKADETPKEEAPSPAAPASAEQAPTDEKKDDDKKDSKRKVRKIDVKVEMLSTWSLPQKTISALRECEVSMIASDKLIADTQEKRNALEEYIYDMRSKISGEPGKFIAENTKADFSKQLQEMEDWLYNEGETATKGVFAEKLDELKKIGGPMVDRFNEAETRAKAIADVRLTMNQLATAAQSWEEKFEHLEEADRAKVTDKVSATGKWLDDLIAQQDKLKLWDTPVLRTAAIYAERESLVSFCTPILNKPKPKPKVEEPPKAEVPKKDETHEKAKTPQPDQPKEANGDDGPSVNMDVD